MNLFTHYQSPPYYLDLPLLHPKYPAPLQTRPKNVHPVTPPLWGHKISEDEPAYPGHFDDGPKPVIVLPGAPVETQVLRQLPGQGQTAALSMHRGGSRPGGCVALQAVRGDGGHRFLPGLAIAGKWVDGP